MTAINNALVVGAGIGGLTAATALAQTGIQTTVVEVQPELTALGVGINQPANALRGLRAIGVMEECLEHGFQFDKWTFTDAADNFITDVPSKLGKDGVPANSALPRPELARILERAARRAGAVIQYGTSVADLSQHSASADVTLSNGTHQEYDLVVAFDGINSPLRHRIFGSEYTPTFTGYSVWRVALERHPDITCATMLQGMGTKAGLFPLSSTSMYLLINTPEPGNPRFAETDFVDLLRQRLAGYDGIVGEIRDGLRSDDTVIYAPSKEVFLPTWHRDRVIVLGDAAHACTPHGTQGAAMAIEDGVVLADELSRQNNLTAALKSFTERRHPRATYIQQASRAILESEMKTTTPELLQTRLAYMATSLRADMQAMETRMDEPA